MPSLPSPRAGAQAGCAALLCAVLGGCAVRTRSPQAHPQPAEWNRVVTADRIAHMNVTTAWEVVGRSGFMVSQTEKNGRPRTLRNGRGRSSLLLADSDTPVVVLDGIRMTDFRVLEQVPASAVLYVRYLSGIEAAFGQGTNAGAGVIEVRTRAGPE